MKKIDKDIIIIVILCITFLEAIALIKGINGTLFMAVIAVIAGLGGYIIPQPNFIKKI